MAVSVSSTFFLNKKIFFTNTCFLKAALTFMEMYVRLLCPDFIYGL